MAYFCIVVAFLRRSSSWRVPGAFLLVVLSCSFIFLTNASSVGSEVRVANRHHPVGLDTLLEVATCEIKCSQHTAFRFTATLAVKDWWT